MIEQLRLGKKYNSNLIDFINTTDTLYITQDNKRKKIKTLKDLKHLLRESSFAIIKTEGTIIKGILFVWKSDYLGNKRNYIKVAHSALVDLDDLLMVLNWKYSKELYYKTKKDGEIISSFRRKGFKLCLDRDGEVLLFRSRNDRRFFAPIKEEDLDDIEELT